MAEKAELTVVKGDLVEEARLVYRDGYQEVLRVYRAAGQMGEVIEVVHDMGPTDDGREIIARFASPYLKNDRVIHTDSNGLEELTRKYREDSVMPVSANYYPITNRVWMASKEHDLRLSIVVDRAHGVASVVDGALEVMLKRRTLGDDGFGVGSPLKENDHYQQTMWLHLGAKKTAVELHKRLDTMMSHRPVEFYFVSAARVEKSEMSLLKKDLPENVQLMNFQLNALADNDYLLRFHHRFMKGEETELANAVTFDVNDYLNGIKVTEMKEYGLSGMFTREQINKERMTWDINPAMKQKVEDTADEGTKVTLGPMAFKTYRVKVAH